MRLAYYPGCSLESSSRAYDLSTRAVCEALDVELIEVDDWNCCGATEVSALNRLAAQALVARNLALVEAELDEIVAPCAACYLNLRKVDKVMREHPAHGARIAACLRAGGLSYEAGRVRVRHLLQVLHDEVGRAALEERVERPLRGVRVAPYYGCQVVRPAEAFDDPEYPRMLDELLRWLGASVIDFPLKTHCCGGHMTQISDEMSSELIRRLLKNATDYQADVIACLCPMCQLNLDAYQGRVNNAFNTRFELPALFFTQLVGLALGLSPEALGFGMEIVTALPTLEARLAEEPEDEGPQRRRKKKDPNALPMPVM